MPGLDAGAGTADATGPRDGGPADASYRAPGCPLVAPHQGDPCTPAAAPSFGQRWPCEYGDDPHCATVAICFDSSAGTSTWQISPPNPACNPNPTCCPSSFDPATGPLYDPAPPSTPTTCPFQGSCTYPEGRCACLPCTVGGGGCRHRRRRGPLSPESPVSRDPPVGSGAEVGAAVTATDAREAKRSRRSGVRCCLSGEGG